MSTNVKGTHIIILYALLFRDNKLFTVSKTSLHFEIVFLLFFYFLHAINIFTELIGSVEINIYAYGPRKKCIVNLYKIYIMYINHEVWTGLENHNVVFLLSCR